MGAITLLISVVAGVAVFCLRPLYGLIIFVAALAWYPSYLSVPIGTVDFTLRRLVILAIFANLFLRTNLIRQFKFIWLDKLVVIYFLCQVIAGTFTTKSPGAFLENRAGAVFDMVLPYFAVRMIIRNKQQYLALLKGILVITAPLAIIGFYQCITGNNPVGFLRKYHAWGIGRGYVPIPRYGFFRADVTFSMSIMYGLFFAMFGPVCAGVLRSAKKYKALYWTGLGLMVVGILASMSAGPWLAALFAILFISVYFYRRYWKITVAAAILLCGTVEIISNRHFYEVIDHFTFSGRTAWYRSRLIEVALFEGGMGGHWLTGFGYGVDPGWNANIDGRDHTDMVNHYLLVLASYGLIGFMPFLAMNVAVAKKLVDAYKASILDSDKWLIWCLSAGLFGLAGAFASVSLFGQPDTVYYMMMAFAGVMPAIVNNKRFAIATAPALSNGRK